MAISPPRRRFCGQCLALGAVVVAQSVPPVHAHAGNSRTRLVAAWNDAQGYKAGLIEIRTSGVQVTTEVELPTRAHGLTPMPDGSVVIVARRPGDWLMRWQPHAPKRTLIRWAEPMQPLNGHALPHLEGGVILTTETDALTDFGLVVMRDAKSLEPIRVWRSGGRDPHQMLAAPGGRCIWVANGGIASRHEAGRARVAGVEMDSSLVEMDAVSGAIVRRYTADDPCLSLRHLSYHPASATLGIAMQAEHTHEAHRQSAPVLGLLRVAPGRRAECIEMAEARSAMQGYGGSVLAVKDGFWVSSPRGDLAGFWSLDGQWRKKAHLPGVCALALSPRGVLMGGKRLVLFAGTIFPLSMHPDNHWSLVA